MEIPEIPNGRDRENNPPGARAFGDFGSCPESIVTNTIVPSYDFGSIDVLRADFFYEDGRVNALDLTTLPCAIRTQK